MLVRIWGARGTLASPGASTKRYGGNTSCIELRPAGGGVVILDAGTGIRELGVRLVAEEVRTIDLLLTHLHVDHLEGLGTFAPLYQKGVKVRIWGPASPVASLGERVATYFSPPLFPVTMAEVSARVEFHNASETEWEIDGTRFVSHAILHPGPTVGYRVEEDGAVLAYLTDHEPALGADLDADATEWISGFSIAHRANLLIHDCQYTPQEYEGRMGWGHTSTDQMATFAARSEVDRVLLFHHDPMHADELLEDMLDDVRDRWGVEASRCEIAASDTEHSL